MKALLIVNPISGTRTKEGLEQKVEQKLGAQGWHIDVAYTTGRGHATRLAADGAANGYDAIITAGGDGTVNEAASALAGTPVPLAILPCGSGNGLARHIDIPLEPERAIDFIKPENIVDVDYALVNGEHPFFCTLGMGFDAEVSRNFAHQNRRGKMTYIRSTLETFLHYNPAEYILTLDDGQCVKCRAFLVAICNASQYGNNAYIAPQASITDGLLDVTLIHAANPLSTMFVGVDMLTGYINRNALIETFRVRSVKVERPEGIPLHIDGEPMPDDFPRLIDVECRPGALRLFASPDKNRFRPIVTPLRAHWTDLVRDMRHLFHH